MSTYIPRLGPDFRMLLIVISKAMTGEIQHFVRHIGWRSLVQGPHMVGESSPVLVIQRVLGVSGILSREQRQTWLRDEFAIWATIGYVGMAVKIARHSLERPLSGLFRHNAALAMKIPSQNQRIKPALLQATTLACGRESGQGCDCCTSGRSRIAVSYRL